MLHLLFSHLYLYLNGLFIPNRVFVFLYGNINLRFAVTMGAFKTEKKNPKNKEKQSIINKDDIRRALI